ncbi:MAG: PAS domain S-box protein [Microcoleaceae cyanobacterium MO_207.B10]|nr:PAS domain S-box protein [Microcoleaceae cyanobacterium MO_207.B10]
MDNLTNQTNLENTVKTLRQEIQQLKHEKEKLVECLNLNQEIQMQQPIIPVNQTEKQQNVLASLALKISQYSDLDKIFKTTVTELRQLLKNDRVIIYQFNSDGSGKVISESVEIPEWSILGRTFTYPCVQENWIEYYQQGKIDFLTDIDTANLTSYHKEMLANLQVKASLVVPILLDIKGKNQKLIGLKSNRKLNNVFPWPWGLLMAHNCSNSRSFQTVKINFFQQLSTNLSIAIQQALLVKNIRKETLARQAKELDVLKLKKQLQIKNKPQNIELIDNDHTICERKITENSCLILEYVIDYGIFMLDHKGYIFTWNQGAKKISGYAESDIIGKHFSYLFSPASIEKKQPQKDLEIATKTGKYEGDSYWIHRDGQQILIFTNIKSFANQSTNQLEGFAVVIQDITAKREQETRLKLLEKAIFSSSNGILITDATKANNPIVYVNPGFEKITGYNVAEVIGKNPRFLQGKDTGQPALEWLRAAIKAETHCYVTLKNHRKDHTVFWNELTISPIRDENGKLTHYVGVQKDITETVAAQIERDRFFDLSIDMLCIANFDGYFVRLNPAWEKTLGYTQEELLSEPFLHFVHPDDREATQAAADEIGQGKKALDFENRYRCKNGSYRWLVWNCTPFAKQRLIYGVARDITERKQVGETLKKNEERFRTVADFTYDWEYWLSPERKFIYVSPSCERITGYTPNEFIQNTKLFKSIVHPKDREMVKQYFEDNFEKDEVFSMDFRIINRRGETKWIDHRCQSVYGEDGSWLGRRVSNRDISVSKQMEVSLRESEERFRSIFNQAGVGIIQATATGDLVLFNEKFIELVKYSKAELRQKKLEDIIHPDDFPAYTKQVKKIWAGQIKSFSLDQRYICQDGSIVWVNISGSMIQNVTAKVQYYMGVIQDINDRKETESALRENQNLFKKAEELAHLGNWEYDILTGKITWSDELFHIFGLPVGQPFTYVEMLEWYYPEDAQYLDKLIQKSIQKAEPYSIEAKILAINGQKRYIFTKGQPVVNKQGQVIKLFGTVQDITNRKRTESALRESEERFRSMADSAPVLIWVSGVDGKCNYFNQVWLKFTGRTLEEELGDGWIKGVHPEDLDYCLNTYINAFNTHQNFQMEYRLRRADGEYRWLLDTGIPRFTSNGEFAGYIGSCIDISETRKNQEELQLWINELELRHQEMILLREMNAFLQVCASAEEAHKMLGDLLKPIFPDCSGAIFRMTDSDDLLAMVASWGKSLNLPIFDRSQCWALRRGQIHLVEANSPSLLCQHIKADNPPAKSLCIPMMAYGGILGLLQLTAMTPEGLSEAKQQLAGTVAENLALALANLELRETLKNQSIRDPLTGLYNRRYLEEFLEQEIHRAQRSQDSVGVIMMDIDHFKRFNDTFGHDAGDLVLKQVGKTLLNAVRKSDVACRYGGEELTLILPGASLKETHKRAEEIRLAIKQLHLRYRNTILPQITSSLGVTCYPQHGNTINEIIRAGDAALYEAKNHGRDQTVVFGTT